MLRNLSRTLLIAGVAWLAAVPALTAQTAAAAAGPIRGDVDGDGRVTAADARIIADFLVGRPVPQGAGVAERGDVNGDGKVTSVDAAIVRAYAAGRDVARFRVGAPADQTSADLIKLQCIAQVRTRSVECNSPGGPANGARAEINIGNQNVYVKVFSSNIVVTADTFAFDVTVQNLLVQKMATQNGSTADPAGVRVFFASGPNTTAGAGEVVVLADSMGTFTTSNQKYYKYSGTALGPDGILDPNEQSSPQTWKLHFDPGVGTFTFQLYVNTELQYPGWVDVYPPSHPSSPYIVPVDTLAATQTLQLTDTVRNAVGRTVPGPVSWGSSDTNVATVDATTGLVTAVADGTATITATSGARTGSVTIVVSTASAATTTITPAPASVAAGDSSLITVQLKNGAGQNVTHSAGTVTLSATAGTLSAVTDHNDGTYTAWLKHTTAGVVTVSGTLNATPIVDTAEVTFTSAALSRFLVEAAAGGSIPDQLAGTPFNVKVTAQDTYGNTVTGFTGKVSFTTTPAVPIAVGAGPSADFTAGVLASHAIRIDTVGDYTLTATRVGGTEAGTTDTFQVQRGPTSVADGPTPTSVPGDPYHTAFNTAFVLPATGVMSNDTRGFPLATVASFGGDSLGGTVTDHAADGTPVGLPGHADGSLTVNANGSLSFTPPTGFTGLYVFKYRISNVRGTSDAQVTIAVGVRPTALGDTYPANVLGNVPINTATSTAFKVTANDAGDAKVVTLGGATNGSAVLNPDGTFTFTPNAGFTGANASFTYTVTNGFGTVGPATVTIPVSGIAWFVNANAASNGDGRLGTPFKDLSSAFAAGTKPLANQPIFLYSSGTSYTGGVTLLAGQRLVGGGATGSSFASVLNVTWPADAGTQPSIGGTSPTVLSGLTLGNGNTLQGFNLGGSGTLSGTSFGTLTVSEVGINSTGQALNLNNGTLAGAGFTQLRSTGGTSNVVLTSVATSGSPALGTSADALSGATAGNGMTIDGGNGSFTYAGTITNGTGLAVSVANKTGGTVVFSGDINPAAANRGISVTGNSSGTNTITFSGANQKISSGAATGVNLANNTGATISFTGGGLAITTGTGNGFNATGGGTVIVDGATDNSTITSAGGIALNVVNTTIGSGGLRFKSISANGGSNGIVLNTTGSTAGLTVPGDGATAGSGGTIQNTTGAGISLASTLSPSFSRMSIQNTGSHGVSGSNVTNFSLTNSTINVSGTSEVAGRMESNISFYQNAGTGTEKNVTGTVTITGNTLNNALHHGVNIIQYDGTITSLNISNNSFTSATASSGSTTGATTSHGSAININPIGSGGTIANVTSATISNNVITGFPGNAGIFFVGGNANVGAPSGSYGTAGDSITIQSNRIRGFSAANPMNTQAISVAVNGRGTGFFRVLDNGTLAEPITNMIGHAINVSSLGTATVGIRVTNNRVVANNQVGSQGISMGADSAAGFASTAVLNAMVNANSVSATNGSGIFGLAANRGTVNLRLLNNSVGTPATGTYGIQLRGGSTTTNSGTMCVDISGNTTSGGVNGGTTFPGIGLRRQSGAAPTGPNVLGIVGLSPSPAGTPTVENYVNSKNTSSSGTFGTGGTALISATTGFTSCTLPF